MFYVVYGLPFIIDYRAAKDLMWFKVCRNEFSDNLCIFRMYSLFKQVTTMIDPVPLVIGYQGVQNDGDVAES